MKRTKRSELFVTRSALRKANDKLVKFGTTFSSSQNQIRGKIIINADLKGILKSTEVTLNEVNSAFEKSVKAYAQEL